MRFHFIAVQRIAIISMTTAAFFLCSAPDALAAPIIHWNLDESSGNVAHDSAAAGGAQDGAAGVQASQWQPTGGIIGGAALFSPASQTDVDEAFAYTSGASFVAYPYTMAAWVKTASDVPYREGIAYMGNHISVEFVELSKAPNNLQPQAAASGPSYTWRDPGSLSSGSATIFGKLNDGAWHHFAVARATPSRTTLYLDGVVASDETASSSPAAFPFTRFSIGGKLDSAPTDSWTGLIDDAAVWDEAVGKQSMALIHGLGLFSHVALDSPSIPQVQTVFNNQSGSVTLGDYTWQYATGLPGAIGWTGMVGSDPYIVLDTPEGPGTPGVGVRGTLVPEPGGAMVILAGVVAAVAGPGRRRNAGTQ